MRALTALTIVLGSVFTACSGETQTSPLSPNAAASALTATPATQSAIVTSPITGQCDLTVLATIPDPAPPVFRQVAAGTCDLAHLGRTSVTFVQVVDFAAGTQHSLELSYTAADGDVLRAASAGTSKVSGSGVTFSATITFTGGTGRFTSASGEAHVEGSADLAAGTSHYELHGQLAYSASDGQGS